jgi:hypothetical protein
MDADRAFQRRSWSDAKGKQTQREKPYRNAKESGYD